MHSNVLVFESVTHCLLLMTTANQYKGQPSLAPDPFVSLFCKVNKSCTTYTFPITSFPLLKRKGRFFLAKTLTMSKGRLVERNTENHFMIKKTITAKKKKKKKRL